MQAKRIAAALLVTCIVNLGRAQTPLDASFTYQGRLDQYGQPLSGSADLQFALYDGLTGGSPLGSQSLPGVSITNGLFAVVLNAGNQFGPTPFNGQKRWLE